MLPCWSCHTCKALQVLLNAASRSAGVFVGRGLVGEDPVPPMIRDHWQSSQSTHSCVIRRLHNHACKGRLTKSMSDVMSRHHARNMLLRVQINYDEMESTTRKSSDSASVANQVPCQSGNMKIASHLHSSSPTYLPRLAAISQKRLERMPGRGHNMPHLVL
jgi:hypothetical protein